MMSSEIKSKSFSAKHYTYHPLRKRGVHPKNKDTNYESQIRQFNPSCCRNY